MAAISQKGTFDIQDKIALFTAESINGSVRSIAFSGMPVFLGFPPIYVEPEMQKSNLVGNCITAIGLFQPTLSTSSVAIVVILAKFDASSATRIRIPLTICKRRTVSILGVNDDGPEIIDIGEGWPGHHEITKAVKKGVGIISSKEVLSV